MGSRRSAGTSEGPNGAGCYRVSGVVEQSRDSSGHGDLPARTPPEPQGVLVPLRLTVWREGTVGSLVPTLRIAGLTPWQRASL